MKTFQTIAGAGSALFAIAILLGTADTATAADAFGYSVKELIGRSFTEFIPERFRQPHREGIRRYLATGERRLPWRGLDLPGLRRDCT